MERRRRLRTRPPSDLRGDTDCGHDMDVPPARPERRGGDVGVPSTVLYLAATPTRCNASTGSLPLPASDFIDPFVPCLLSIARFLYSFFLLSPLFSSIILASELRGGWPAVPMWCLCDQNECLVPGYFTFLSFIAAGSHGSLLVNNTRKSRHRRYHADSVPEDWAVGV